MSMLFIYATFDDVTGELLSISGSVAGAGSTAIGHCGGLMMHDGSDMEVEALTAALLADQTVHLHLEEGAAPVVRIERRFLSF